jgi:hypothetical protein
VDPCTKDLSLDKWAAQIEPALWISGGFKGIVASIGTWHYMPPSPFAHLPHDEKAVASKALIRTRMVDLEVEMAETRAAIAVCTRQIKKKFTVLLRVKESRR